MFNSQYQLSGSGDADGLASQGFLGGFFFRNVNVSAQMKSRPTCMHGMRADARCVMRCRRVLTA